MRQNFTNRLMENDNYYIQNAIHVWRMEHATYCLIQNLGKDGTFLVRVLPSNEDVESYWLDEGQSPWETEAGAAWSILNSISD